MPVQGVRARVHTVVPYYGRTFGLFGRLANLSVVTPFADAFVVGEVKEESKSIDRTGFGDPAARLAVNLIGGPALTPQEFPRGGLTLADPVMPNQSLKLTWSTGVTTRIGTGFQSFGVAWQVLWF